MSDLSPEPLCPLPNCLAPLYFVRSFMIPVEDALPYGIAPENCISDGWEIVCGNDHRLDAGDSEHDCRGDARLGYRRALSLGGLR